MFTQFTASQGQVTYWKAKVRGKMKINPYKPSRKTILNALISYLLKIIFYATIPILLNKIERTRRTVPINCIVISLLYDDELKLIATTCTLVIPKNVRRHPIIDNLLKTLLRISLDSKAVNTIFPPRSICQTELSTIFKAV